MDQERWQKIEELFHEALERAPESRQAFLDVACGGDADLQRQVELLLAKAREAGSFLETPAMEDPAVTAIAAESLLGRQIGPYRIVSPLGAGGMGEVYRAHDSKLGRDVAIKTLPAEFARDPERLARFRREARTLASLNHSNIGAIYGLEQFEDADILVLELVLGETLADQLGRGPIPIEESLKLALQIAEALEAAHEKGIIHRDLKPANVKVTPEGMVKVLDFGLATALEGEAAERDGSDSPMLSLAAIKAGVILGTAAYMSPEQARGSRVDKRCDIWSFGVVLFEMLAGKQLFAGPTISDTLAAVLRAEIDWSILPGDTPVSIRTLLLRCLNKDRKQRLQAIGEARIAIEEYLADPKSASGLETAPVAVLRRSCLIAWSVAIICLIGALALGVLYLRQAPADEPETRLEINTPSTSNQDAFAISPDGRRLVFVASTDGQKRLWLRPLNQTALQLLPGTEGAMNPFWSPDSRSIGFFADGKLKRIDIAGGLPQALASALKGNGAWNRDGVIVFAPSNFSPLYRVQAAGGEPVAITRLDPPRQFMHLFPRFLSDGRHFLFNAMGSPEASGIYLGSLDGGEPKLLTVANSAGGHLKPDWVLSIQQRTLMARRLDVARGEWTGDPVTVADGVLAFSVSLVGRVAYRAEGGDERRQLTWFDRTGNNLGVASEPDANDLRAPELSPDGRRIAVDRTVQNNTDVWLMDLARGGFTRLTSEAAFDGTPLWSPDGTRIAFGSNRGSYDIWIKPASGTGAEELLLGTPKVEWPIDWSKDGRFLIYSQSASKALDLWALPMTGKDRKPVVVSTTSFGEQQGQFSPDGRWVAYQTDESGSGFEIVVQAFPDPSGKWQVSTGGGVQPRWRADGKELYFITPDRKLMAVPVAVRGSSLEAGKPVPLFATRISDGGGSCKPQYVVTRDGRFLINQVVEASTATPITLILNWDPERKK
jgi:serine/threonine protein kinase/Tol biopolymer transport system component